jgi:hypothetical protein
MLSSYLVKNLCFGLALILVATTPAFGQIGATATVSTPQLSAPFTYSMTLNNTGTTSIGTFWFGWVPGLDFLPTSPSSIQMPAGWSSVITGGGAGDGFAIMFNDGGTLLASGASLSGFQFNSNDTTAQLSGNSPAHPTFKTTTSFVYSGPNETGSSLQFVVSVVPEPSTIVLAGIGGLMGLLAYRRQRKCQ